MIKSKLGSAKGKKPTVVNAKKGKRTIAPKRTVLVKNAKMIKVSDIMLNPFNRPLAYRLRNTLVGSPQ